jgi:uncharacterized protein YdhG (YjbR/CyaY superfamily)
MSFAARDIDDYMAELPEETRVVLEALRRAIKAAAPEATESISYQIPTFNYRGPLVAFAAWKRHCGFYPMSKAVVDAHKDELKPFDTAGAKNTIRFPLGKPPPAALVKKIVKARVKENEARVKK